LPAGESPIALAELGGANATWPEINRILFGSGFCGPHLQIERARRAEQVAAA
jgi:hypothetical protein